jgi:hypothetical protein
MQMSEEESREKFRKNPVKRARYPDPDYEAWLAELKAELGGTS